MDNMKYNTPDRREPAVGDWVRFYQNGLLIIGVVNYIKKSALGNEIELYTDNGATSIGNVVEMRRHL